MCVVADRGFVSEATLEALSKMDPPVHYVIGVRMRRTKEVGEVVLKSRKEWKMVTPERVDAKDPAPLKVKEVKVAGRRYVVCLNEEEKRKDAHDRAAILESLGDPVPSARRDQGARLAGCACRRSGASAGPSGTALRGRARGRKCSANDFLAPLNPLMISFSVFESVEDGLEYI